MKFHKKFHVVAMLAAILALNAQAAEVSSVQVKRAVSAWAAANGSAFANPGSVTGATPVIENGTNLYWIVTMSNGGAVIASPDTDLDLVIAVLEKSDGTFPAGHPLPSILKKDMKNRLSIVRSGSTSSSSSGNSGVHMASMLNATTQSTAAELPEDVKSSVLKANAQWAKYGNTNAGVSLLGSSLTDGDASPYVRRIVDGFETGGRFTHWNQSLSPNDKKPLYNLYTTNNAVCGCVATAGSAIMQFFGCTNDIGVVKGVGCTYNEAPIECSTRPGALDWSLLPTNGVDLVYECVSTNGAARDLIGRVAYNMGVLVGMGWTDGESGAVTILLADAFKKYGFKAARAVAFDTGAKGTAQYFKTVYAQNWAGAPVVLSIRGDSGGHAVVACGYAKDGDGDEFCRVFMGWGGSGDSWYKFPKIDSFSTVNHAVTMIGLDDDAVVPVCGWSNVPSTEFEVLSDDSADPVAIAEVDGSGYFAVRIPASLNANGLRIRHSVTDKELDISPYDSSVFQNDEAELADLEAALPDEMEFLGLNTITKTSVSAARAKAKEVGKALLMVSGSGGERDSLLVNYICHLDATTDMSNKFVFVHVNSATLASQHVDGDPSIGIFDPYLSTDENRWWEGNGRLAYDNFIDYDATACTNDVIYKFSADDTAYLTNAVSFVMADGYDKFLRNNSGISVSVEAVDVLTGTAIPLEGALPECGEFNNVWTNGEVAVFSAPATYTNEAAGIVYSCLGWTTNGCITADCAVKGNEVSIALSTSNDVSFAWLWERKAFKVEALAEAQGFVPEDAVEIVGATGGTECWRVIGDRVTVKAAPAVQNGEYGLKRWFVSTISADPEAPGVERGLEGYNDAVLNGSALSFTVTEPVSVKAVYKSGLAAAKDPEEYSVTVTVDPAELADLMNEGGSLGLGENTTYDPVVSLEAFTSESVIDSTGGVWKCTGWVVNGVTNAPIPNLESGNATNLELLWEFQEPEPEIVILDPVPVNIGGISMENGKFLITIPGAKKGWKYYLYCSSNLSDLSGDSSTWPKDESVGENPLEAAEDGSVVFQSTPSGGSMFWRAMEQEIRK